MVFFWHSSDSWLVVWNMAFMTFHSVGNVIIPSDELIFFRVVGIPPTRWWVMAKYSGLTMDSIYVKILYHGNSTTWSSVPRLGLMIFRSKKHHETSISSISRDFPARHVWFPENMWKSCFFTMNGETTDTTPKKSKSVIVWYQCRNYAIPSEDDCCRVSGSTWDWKIPGWCADLFGMKQFDLKWTVYPIMLTKCWNQ